MWSRISLPRGQNCPRSTGGALSRRGNLLNPKAGVIFVSILPQFIRPGDSLLRLTLMLLIFEAMLLGWLNLYGYLVTQASHSRFGAGIRRVMQRLTGVVLLGLGLRLAAERR